MSTCLLPASPTAACQRPGNPTSTTDQNPGNPGGGGGTDYWKPPGSVVSPPGSIVVSFESDERTATLIGFEEFMTPSTPPKKYRNKTISGSLAIDKTSASTTCSSTLPGAGTQSGDFFVFYFFNETVNGVVSCALTSIDFDTNTAHYQFTLADWSEVDVLIVDRDTTNWYAAWNSTPVSVPSSFSVTLGHTFSLSIAVQAVFGYGGGSWNYEAGRETFTDAWSQFAQYHAVTGVLSTVFANTRSPGTTIPDRNSGVTNFDPGQVYVPLQNLLFLLEPGYVSEATVSSVLKTVTGLGCCPTVSGFGRQSINCVGTVSTVLSDEDTEDDAWNRATPAIGASHIAQYEQRGAGDFTFLRTDVTVLITTVGLQLGASYRISIPIVTSDFDGSNPVSSVTNLDFTASAPSEDLEQDILAARGKKVTVGTVTLVIL